MSDRILIVGAGVVGLTIAWELARLGEEVVVLERQRPGAGATSVAGGMLGLTAEVHFGEEQLLRLQQESLRLFPDYVSAVRDEAGIDPGYRREPTLVVARDRDDVEALERVFEYQESVGLSARWLDTKELSERAPHLRNITRAVACPDDHFVDTERLTEALVKACRNQDVEFVDNACVDAVISDETGARGVVVEDGRKFFAGRTVICAGTWSGGIENIPEFERSILRPVRGQVIAVDTDATPLIDCVVRSPEVYLVPRTDGRILIGSTMEEKGFRQEVTAGAVRTLLREAWRILPGIDELPITALKSGFRPVSLDGRPLLGPSTVENLFIAGGHGRHGILLAPITGRIMARHLLHSGKAHRSFDPRRFA